MQGLTSGAHVGVVGGGATGTGIARAVAFAGHPVVELEVGAARATAAAASVAEPYRESGGCRTGPLQLTERIGQESDAAVTDAVWRALGLDPHDRPSRLQRSLDALEQRLPGGRSRVRTPLRVAAVRGVARHA